MFSKGSFTPSESANTTINLIGKIGKLTITGLLANDSATWWYESVEIGGDGMLHRKVANNTEEVNSNPNTELNRLNSVNGNSFIFGKVSQGSARELSYTVEYLN